ncbi:MAG: hypothetical protein K6B70_01075 [Clostridia bacterium]|nr:hypothetical protein [Clostridia bacterium]
MSNKKKTIIISAIVLVAFVIMGFVYAIFTDKLELVNKFRVGSVQIDTKDLMIKKNLNDTTKHTLLAPGDIDYITWTTDNLGKSAVLTRHTLEITWEGDQQFYLYPANTPDEIITTDFKDNNAGNALTTEPITNVVDGVEKVVGMKYNFTGDTLDGSDNNDSNSVSKEENYNSTSYTANTDDTEKKSDKVAFKILLSPKTNYLQQGKKINLKVKTEGMQYTEEGAQEGNWVAADVEEIGD